MQQAIMKKHPVARCAIKCMAKPRVALLPRSNAAAVSHAALPTPETTSTPTPAASTPIVVNMPPPTPEVVPPAGAYENVVKAGAAKAAMPAWKTLLLGVLAGFYISLGGLMVVSIGGNLPEITANNPGLAKLICGIVFPFGLMINVLAGGELFTGNTAFVTAAVYEKKATWGQLFKNWIFSYIGNFIGAMMMVGIVLASGLVATNAMPIAMANMKCNLPFFVAFTRGILANWLVCSGVWMASATSSLPGKTIALWLPVCAFIAMGFEHSVANMFSVPLGIALGAQNANFMQFLTCNLVPVTLGNICGGFVFMATAYSLCYGALGKGKQ